MFCEAGIDWAATGAMLGGIGAVLTALVAIAAVQIAYPEWKQREAYAAAAKDARTLLTTFFEGRQAIDAIRSPFVHAGEIADAEKVLEAAPNPGFWQNNDPQRRRQSLATFARIQRHNELWDRVLALSTVAKVVFGNAVEEQFKKVMWARQQVYAATQVYPNAERDFLQQMQKVLWKGYTGEAEADPIDSQLDAATTALQNALGKYFQHPA